MEFKSAQAGEECLLVVVARTLTTTFNHLSKANVKESVKQMYQDMVTQASKDTSIVEAWTIGRPSKVDKYTELIMMVLGNLKYCIDIASDEEVKDGGEGETKD